MLNDKHHNPALPLHSRRHRWLTAALLCASVLGATPALAANEPAQKPLLSSQTGAKPNLMIAIDNSGSMAFTYHETYNVTGNATRNSESAGTFYWSAQRSAEVNPVYYNPRVRYLPRVDGNGAVVSPRDPRLPDSGSAYNVVWISNQNSATFRYVVYQRNNGARDFRIYHSMYADDSTTRNFQGYVNTFNPTGFTNRYDLNYTQRIPQHIAYTSTATANSAPAFTYAYCSAVVTNASGQQTGCSARTTVNVSYGGTATHTIPTPNTRTDCTNNVCTNAQEVANILNWYRWYSTRQLATSTAIGLALADTDADGAPNDPSELNGNLRIGYMPINENYSAPLALTPGSGASVTLSRGVRPLSRNSTDNTNLFNWLNGILPQGGTPLHYAIGKAADYYRVASGVTENPWRTDPTNSSSPEMSCRRSFNLLFSDGAWTPGDQSNGTTWGPRNAGPDYDNTNGPTPAHTRTLANGNTDSFAYQRYGINTPAGRRAYTPYPSSATGGVADLTAQYYWHTDLRTSLANNVQTRSGQPTFWQNMTTYTVGYLIRPSGEVPGATSGLTFDQITNYQAQYAASGYTAATKPTWPTGNLISSTDQARVDDFIHAGYTGGGRGFSAQSADDVRTIFNTVLADILNAAGRDAGVAVSTDATNTSTIAGRLKYSVSYKTINNTGDIVAQRLDASGNSVRDANGLPVAEWTASETIPDPDARKVFTITGDDTGVEFRGNFSSLDTDVQAALRHGPDASRIDQTNSDFVDYLRGKDPVADADGVLFRQRESKIGAMVNPPSIYMGASRDFAYDLSGSVDGSGDYLAYIEAKHSLPASLMVATNAGVVHNLHALNGTELAAFMPRRSLTRMLDYAKASYSFEYILDGPLSEHDIYDGSNWNHLAVGTGGRGEKLIYGLRSPLNQSGTGGNREPGAQDFLWEQGPDTLDATDLKLGHMTQPARSGQTENGTWVAVLNSGHYNGEANGRRHGLVLIDPMTGALVRRIALPSTADAGRGLSGVTLVRNGDKRIVAAYAGDANGNLWRFDLRGAAASWKVSYGRPLFTTIGNRPIYSAPAWQAHPREGNIVVVATGMLMDDDDLTDTATNAIYGIWDPTVLGEDDASPFTTVTPSQLVVQSIDTSVAARSNDSGTNTYNRTTRNQINWATHRGWTFALGHTHAGERSLDQIRNVGTSVFINTTVIAPQTNANDEMCTASGLPLNYIYGFRAVDGATQYSFDVDGDGKLDNVSMVLVGGGGYSRGMALANLYDSPPDDSTSNSIRARLSIDEPSGESDPTPQKCRNVNKAGLGTEDGSIGLGVYCPVAGWSRTQFQLSTPPRN